MILPSFLVLSLISINFATTGSNPDLHEEIRILKDRLAKLESSATKEIHEVHSELLNEMEGITQ